MSLKLNTASGGSITLQEADTASNLTLTVPAQAGSVVTADSSGNLLFNSGYGSAATAYGCRAWVNFDGTGTVAIRASGNVSSITDNGTGDYTVNFTNAMPDANYVASGLAGSGTTATSTFTGVRGRCAAPNTSSYRIQVFTISISSGVSSPDNREYVELQFFR
jgi:uncharacterized protein (AIM24 family)